MSNKEIRLTRGSCSTGNPPLDPPLLARVPRHMQAAFRGRKHNPTQNVMAVVDFDLKFTYVLIGWEVFAHDALILANAIERNDGFTVPEGNYTT